MDLTIIPYLDIAVYRKELRFRSAPIKVRGHVPHTYVEEVDGTGVPAWTHRPIGGITANVTPKFRAEIDAKPDGECQTGIGVRGTVRPGVAGQTITIAVQPVGGTTFYVETRTGPGGSFRACIDPRRGDQTSTKPWEGRPSGKIQGLFEVVCDTGNAADLAYARSTPLYFDLSRGKRRRRSGRVRFCRIPSPTGAPKSRYPRWRRTASTTRAQASRIARPAGPPRDSRMAGFLVRRWPRTSRRASDRGRALRGPRPSASGRVPAAHLRRHRSDGRVRGVGETMPW
jgi:hypothetical protein